MQFNLTYDLHKMILIASSFDFNAKLIKFHCRSLTLQLKKKNSDISNCTAIKKN